MRGSRDIQFGIRLHNYDSWEITKRTAQPADKLGFDSLWLNDHALPPVGHIDEKFREDWSSLAVLAVLTARLKVGTLVVCKGFRAPALLAKMAASLDLFSGGDSFRRRLFHRAQGPENAPTNYSWLCPRH